MSDAAVSCRIMPMTCVFTGRANTGRHERTLIEMYHTDTNLIRHHAGLDRSAGEHRSVGGDPCLGAGRLRGQSGDEFERRAVGGTDDGEVSAVEGPDPSLSEALRDGDDTGVGAAER